MNDSGTLCEEVNQTPRSGEICEALCEAAPPSRRNLLGAAAGAVAGILPFFLFPKESEAISMCKATCQPAGEGTCCEDCSEASCQDHCQICCIAGHEASPCDTGCQTDNPCDPSCQTNNPCDAGCQNCQTDNPCATVCEHSCQEECQIRCQDACQTYCQIPCEVPVISC